ncbi:hypothetical protein JAAARDRAFT_59227 [Jaapia argillacea MUCL 33604]|uniref:Uncharacterized protein n=1 Tax=Jaapia argillacea MUCL 33604 TaxID=933084 RepID=A0A067PR94_9AGAM|nr:hypothetical protein JAAARDRAFT_59227 [Jaapia argillacea MUCL 33604]
MVKKPATPPPSDDEPRYLTVVYPYPASAYMLESDVKQMAFWLACITKPQNLWAIYHKPSARNMIIIEVARNFQGFRELLGEHKWSQFLRNPSDDEKTKSSKIFYCTLGSGREVQKEGWKKTDIQDAWFTRGWTPINKIIEHPYPLSSRCDPPTEDITNKPFCRPLPVALFPPENMPPPIPVGSPEWIEAKQGPPGSAAWTAAKTGSGKAKSAGGAWGKGAPALVIPNRGGGGTRVSPSPAVATSSPAVNSSKSPSVNPWPAIGGSKSPSVQSGWSARSPGSAVSSTSPFVPPVMGAPWNPTSPPGIQSPASSCLSPSFDFDGPPGLVRSNTNSGTSSSSQQSASSDDDNERSNHGSSVIAPTPSVAAPGAVEFMEEMYTSMSDLAVADYAPDWEIQSVVTATHSDSVSSYQQDDADEEASLWDDHATNGSKPSDDVIACPHHGKECTKGICSWRSDLERKKAKEKRATEAKQNANTKRGRGANNNGEFGSFLRLDLAFCGILGLIASLAL